jgi:transposase InsO family protein
MPHTIQFESRTVEFPAILLMENAEEDDPVIEVWDQPPSFVIRYEGAKGRNLGHTYTADFFVIRENSAGWEEWKLESELIKLADENPQKYIKGDDGVWRYPPVERYAEPFGLYARVRSSAEINWVLIRNFRVLQPCFDAFRNNSESNAVHESLKEIVAAEPGITMAELLDQVEGAANVDLFALIVTGQVYVDLRLAWLGEPKRVQVFRDGETAKFFQRLSDLQQADGDSPCVDHLIPATTCLWDGISLEIVHVGSTKVTCYRKKYNDFPEFPKTEFERWMRDGVVTDFITRPNVARGSEAYKITQRCGRKEDLADALWKYDNIVEPKLRGERVADTTLTTRTHRNIIKKYQSFADKYGNGLLGLLSRHHDKGNRTDRLALMDPTLRPDMEDFIANHVEDPTQRTINLSYGQFLNKREKEGKKTPSYRTFLAAVKKRAGPEQSEKTQGSKVAYQQQEFIDIEGWDEKIPLHGDRPWEYAHIDHTVVDVILRHTDKGVIMGKAWVTLLIDAFSRRVLAYYLTYEKPSYVSCMGVIRECVRLHGRLPECFIADRGSEFRSVYFESLVAGYRCDIIWRPPTKPRFGAIIERFILTMNKQLIHNLKGNTKSMKNARQVTKEVDPRNQAEWDFPRLDEELEKYLYQEYPTRMHSGLGQSPLEAFNEGIARFPLPQPDKIEYDDNFLINTMPSTRKGTAKFYRSRGFKIFGIWYRSRQLRRQELYDKQLEVRIDYWNMAHAYAWDGRQWVICYAPPGIYANLKGRTEREVRVLTEEHRQLYRIYGRDFKGRAKDLAEKHAPRESRERLEMQRRKDAEMRESAARRGRRLSPAYSGEGRARADSNPATGSREGRDIPTGDSDPKVFKRAMKVRRGGR